MVQQAVVAAPSIHVEVEVAAIHNGVGGVATCEHIEHHILGAIILLRVVDGDVAHHAAHLIIFLEVGGHIDVGASRNG